MNNKVQQLHSNNKDTTINLRFASPVISPVPVILKNTDINCRNLRGMELTTPAKQSPAVNKFLNLGNENDSLLSNSTSPGSPLDDSAKKKLCDLPHTTTLRGCVAYVDVWSSDATDNRSSVFRNFLTRMGATVARKFTKDEPITHVVFKDGHKSFLQKAQKRNIKIVSCLWVDRCRVLQRWVNEDEFLFDHSKYKPPKRFVEMQPLEPDELIQKSAERLKRRKARFAKKNARIMFQSPLVTNTRSANGTPIGGHTPTKQDIMKKNGTFAADTPFHHSPSICRYFSSPSVVCDTPLTDSMQRMIQRRREGKRILSSPSSEDNSDEENVEINESPDRPTRNGDLPKRKSEAPADGPKFSPVADTQRMVKRSWRESGISPPKFNVSCDEIPETQNIEVPDTPEQLLERSAGVPAFVEEIPETQHRNTSASSRSEAQLPDQPLFTSTAKDYGEELSFSKDTEIRNSQRLQLYGIEDDSTPEIRPRVGGNSSHLEDTGSFLKRDFADVEEIQNDDNAEECTPTEQKIFEKPVFTSRRKRRKLLQPCSGRERKSSLLLPELELSASKNLTQSGNLFGKLTLRTPSESSSISQQSSSKRSTCNTQSPEFGNCQQSPVQSNTGIVQQFNTPLSLYDRVKMRPKRNSTLSLVNSSIMKKRRRGNSDQYHSPETTISPQPEKKLAKTQKSPSKVSPLFYSKTARAILENVKNRRSTLDFTSPMVKSSTTTTQSLNKKNEKKFGIVLTNFHSGERLEVHEAIKNLSKFRVTSAVRDQTTHVVCGAARRTMDVLRAIARGVWLLSKNWVTDSLAAGFWLEEESYEISSLFPAAQKNRKRKTKNPMWKNELFAKFEGHIYISDNTEPPQEDLKELVTLCGGSIVGSPRRAILCVGNPGRVILDIPVVNETWVLDSVSEDLLKPFGPYLISLNQTG